MIETKDISFSYDNQHMIRFPDLRCESNDILLLIGKSGVGKTTLLHLIGGLMKSRTGYIKVNDTILNDLNKVTMDRFRGQHIGIIFQQAHFVRSINALENLMLAQSLAGKKADRSHCLKLLDRLGIGTKAYQKTNNLSQGEKQRLSIARALVNNPAVILADEPTSALDDDNCNEVLSLLEEQASEVGAALIIVTHDSRLKNSIENQILLTA